MFAHGVPLYARGTFSGTQQEAKLLYRPTLGKSTRRIMSKLPIRALRHRKPWAG